MPWILIRSCLWTTACISSFRRNTHTLRQLSTVKYPDKNLSGKSDEREVKMCKSGFFTLHSSSPILRKHSFHTAKHKLWLHQRSCFTAWNITFHTMKPYLSHDETLPFANPFFVNKSTKKKFLRNHLVASDL